MANTRGAARRLTASGAPKQGTVARRKPAVQRQSEKAAKAKKALKNPRTGKQKRVVNRLMREAREADADADRAMLREIWGTIGKVVPGLELPLDKDKQKDDARFELFEKEVLPTLATSNATEAQINEILDKLFRLEDTKQLARDLLAEEKAKAQDDDVDMDASPGELNRLQLRTRCCCFLLQLRAMQAPHSSGSTDVSAAVCSWGAYEAPLAALRSLPVL